MRLRLRKPAQSLNKAYASQPVSQNSLSVFRRALAKLVDRVDENESETDQKNRVAEFFRTAFDRVGEGDDSAGHSPYQVNNHDRISLSVHGNPAWSEPADGADSALPGMGIAVKKVFAGDMVTTLKNNVRALHELILYYFETRERDPPIIVNQLIVSDVYNWFIFDESEFRRFFYENAKLQKLYQTKRRLQKDAAYFYTEAARILRGLDEEVTVTYLNLRDAADALTHDPAEGNRILIPVYKLLSPEHLFNLPFANDGNTFDHRFYAELLHIVGLRETTGSKRGKSIRTTLRRLPDGERHPGSLLENTITGLRSNQALAKLDRPDHYGSTDEEQLAAVGWALCLTWLGRVLFLKVLESQLMHDHRAENGLPDRSMQFLTVPYIRTFGDLNDLFFAVMAVPEASRPVSITARFDSVRPIPYLNSSLFEPTDLERTVLTVDQVQDRIDLPLYARSVLANQASDSPADALPTLVYLLAFLDGYAIPTDGPAGVLPNNKPFITTTGLGLVLEKLSGFQNDLPYTPGFLSTYVVRDAIRQAVITRFNEQFGWTCTSVADLRDLLNAVDPNEANATVNGLRLVDPAVGSGHFLVSALNELIALKADIGILTDRDGQPLRQYDIRVQNDRLTVANADGTLFQYMAPRRDPEERPTELQRVQETLFREKLTLIENCLFGVDNNSNALAIGRLRLWMELLKSMYYVVKDGKAEKGGVKKGSAFLFFPPLPNLNMNMKVGNSLVSRVEPRAAFTYDTDGLQSRLTVYRGLVPRYFYETDSATKSRTLSEITDIQGYLSRQFVGGDRAMTDKLQRLTADYSLKYQTNQLFSSSLTAKQIKDRDKLRADIDRLRADIEPTGRNLIFGDALEWRFMFPQLLDERGNFSGFDVVVSQPPGIRPSELVPFQRHFQRAYPNTYTRSAEGYVYFVELGLTLLRPNGQLAYVLPRTWLQVNSAVHLRAYLKTQCITRIGIPLALPQWTTLTVQKAGATGQFRVGPLETEPYAQPGVDDSGLASRVVSTDLLDDTGWPIF